MYRAQRDFKPEALRNLTSITTTARTKFDTDCKGIGRMKHVGIDVQG